MSRPQKPVLALDIAPLGERRHTGIPNVVKALAREMLADEQVAPKFFMQRGETPRGIVERILDLDSGEILWWLSGRLDARPTFAIEPGRTHAAIYAAAKRHRRLFPVEVQIVHDLTAILMPQFHTDDAVRWWRERLLVDMLTSDLIVAVSHSTAADIRTYFPEVGHIPCLVAPLGVSVGATPALAGKVEDYVVVLGTLEPRKNVRAVLECLSGHPDLLAETKFVFIGGWGWGETAHELVRECGLADEIARGNLVFTGFVSNEARDALVANARFVVYPSRYEGFGLPVLESLALGTPVLTSFSSSLPEAGGDAADYCDFDSPDSFLAALRAMLARPRFPDARRKEWAQGFDWTKAYRTIRDAALGHALVD